MAQKPGTNDTKDQTRGEQVKNDDGDSTGFIMDDECCVLSMKKSDDLLSIKESENYFDLFKQTRNHFEFKNGEISQRFQLPIEKPAPTVLIAVENLERYLQRLFAEFFCVLRVALAFAVAVSTELVKLFARSLVQPIVTAIFTIIGSHILQPFLTSFFNFIIHPVNCSKQILIQILQFFCFFSQIFSFLAVSFNSMQKSLQPAFTMVGCLLTKFSDLFRNLRCIEINVQHHHYHGSVQLADSSKDIIQQV